MRLIHIPSLQLREFDSDPPPYVIASHRWTKEEVKFQEFTSLSDSVVDKAGFKKILGFCEAITRLMSLCPKLIVEYLWIDTCCIDKTNSVELQEALNSMFRWYAEAEVCLAYLHDVESLDEHPTAVMESFKSSVWHKRGWTLQELLAPKRLLFYNRDWEIFGRKRAIYGTPWITTRVAGLMPLNDILAEITGIPAKVFWDFDAYVDDFTLKEKASWMSGRSTTRVEDRVYCQLGIFGVFIPLIYGEGEHAMYRLEEAIAQKQRREAIRANSSNARPPDGKPRTFTIHCQVMRAGRLVLESYEETIPNDKPARDLEQNVLQRLREIDPRFGKGLWALRTHWAGQGDTIDTNRLVATIVESELYWVPMAAPPGSASDTIEQPESSKIRTFTIRYGRRYSKEPLSKTSSARIAETKTVQDLADLVGEVYTEDGTQLKRWPWRLATEGDPSFPLALDQKIATIPNHSVLYAEY